MGTLEYWWKVGIPLWWKDAKVVINFAIGAFLLIFIAAPIGYIMTKKEGRKKNNAGTVPRRSL